MCRQFFPDVIFFSVHLGNTQNLTGGGGAISHVSEPVKVATLDFIFFSPAAMLFSVISAFLVPIIPKLCLKFIIIHF